MAKHRRQPELLVAVVTIATMATHGVRHKLRPSKYVDQATLTEFAELLARDPDRVSAAADQVGVKVMRAARGHHHDVTAILNAM